MELRTLYLVINLVSYLADAGLKHRTIKVYLSGVRFLHIVEGFHDPFKPVLLRLEYTLRGVKKSEAEKSGGSREHLPISPHLLNQIKVVWESSALTQDEVMLWAACCLAFFGFLSTGEMTVPNDHSYDPACHLSFGDVAVDNASDPSLLCVTIKQSKTDPFRKGIDLYIGQTFTEVCPLVAMLRYLVKRDSRTGSLFCYEDGRLLTTLDFSKSQFRELQEQDTTLEPIRQAAEDFPSSARIGFFKRYGFLYRR